MEKKLSQLREEYNRGQHHLELLDRQRQEVRDTLLRITGAIQVLDELLQEKGDAASNGKQEPHSRLEAATV